ncbi:hydroxyacid dehydrogenase [Cerasicoccus frondis]|uniref:hydroxyacid dehydrogenase n=1 Tax=Cerasicoccus frondis TaxID=490090 RepID=UPI00285281D6|nr:hydroxyacid dehydrogenase [Cerasicoccus frondis]
MSDTRPISAFVLRVGGLEQIYSQEAQQQVRELTNPLDVQLTNDNWRDYRDLLRRVEYILSGWGMPVLDEEFLDSAPALRHVFYGSGSVRNFYTEAARLRGIGVSSAWEANAIPTAEFAHSLIVLSLKHFWRSQRETFLSREWSKPPHAPGVYRSKVGLVSLGAVGKRVAGMLDREHTLHVSAYDPFIADTDAAALGAKLTSLEDIFSNCDVISLHCPSLPETRRLVGRELLESMKPYATLVNTARGDLIDEAVLLQVLQKRQDLEAILDVTSDEPENAENPLWDLTNVTITPHIAGSINGECRRMGAYMVDELERCLCGLPLKHEVTESILKTMA